MIESGDDVDRLIKLVKRERSSVADVVSRDTLEVVVEAIAELADRAARRK